MRSSIESVSAIEDLRVFATSREVRSGSREAGRARLILKVPQQRGGKTGITSVAFSVNVRERRLCPSLNAEVEPPTFE